MSIEIPDDVAQRCENIAYSIEQSRQWIRDTNGSHYGGGALSKIQEELKKLEDEHLERYKLPDKTRYPYLYEYMQDLHGRAKKRAEEKDREAKRVAEEAAEKEREAKRAAAESVEKEQREREARRAAEEAAEKERREREARRAAAEFAAKERREEEARRAAEAREREEREQDSEDAKLPNQVPREVAQKCEEALRDYEHADEYMSDWTNPQVMWPIRQKEAAMKVLDEANLSRYNIPRLERYPRLHNYMTRQREIQRLNDERRAKKEEQERIIIILLINIFHLFLKKLFDIFWI